MKPSRIFSLFSLFVLLAMLFGPGAQPVSAGGRGMVLGSAILTVNSANEGDDAVLNGICATSGGVCTLRAAMQEANYNPNPDTIWFNLPGSGMHVISITSGPLPNITDPLNLDGTFQTNCVVPCIVLSGAALSGTPSGLVIAANDSIVKGFVITSFSNYGIMIVGDGNTVQSNDIGFWPGNPSLLPNGAGIFIWGSNNLIGGTSAAERNVISGNNWHGIVLANGSSPVTSGNIIEGNYIGTDETGMAARSNAGDGIMLYQNATYTTIGGSTSGSGNVISANSWSGIETAGSHTTIRGNFIGTRADGKGSLGNTGQGIMVDSPSSANVIGGSSSAAKNRIAHNGLNGILLVSGSGRTTLSHNRIFANGGLAIDLNGDGVTPNDAMDADTGPNRLQNYPTVSSATGSTGVIVARLYSQAGSTYTFEFFSSTAGTCDPSGHGEGKTFLGSATGVTDGTGYVRVVYTSPLAFPVGAAITATATDSTGRTSEFSACKTAG